MEWDLKAPCWDEATIPNIETTMEESISRYGVYRMKGGFSVDLKLGHHVGNSGSTESQPLLPVSEDVAAAAPTNSSKRARAFNNAATLRLRVSCLVDGCNSDLTNCRDYHRRHKVCELHSKTPEVTIAGQKQRFCQQCSRFHSLEQFDERKRSCRKRLDGHNRRRRKPQPEPLTRSAASFLSSTYQGTQLLPFSSSTPMVNPSWSGGLVTSCVGGRLHIHNQHQQLHVIDKQDLFLGSTTTSYGEGKQLAFLHSADHNPSTATLNNQTPPLPIGSTCHTLPRTNPLSQSCEVRTKMFCDNSPTTSVHDESPCALSLLSSSQTHTPGNGLNQMVQPQSMSTLMQPLGLGLHGNSFESMDRVLVPNGSESNHCSSMYNSMGSNGSQGNEAPQLFPYHWE